MPQRDSGRCASLRALHVARRTLNLSASDAGVQIIIEAA
jgi:hypothetical protein